MCPPVGERNGVAADGNTSLAPLGQVPPQPVQGERVVLAGLVEPPTTRRPNVRVQRRPRRPVGVCPVVGELPVPILGKRVTVGLIREVEQEIRIVARR